MLKSAISNFLRNTGLLFVTDYVRYKIEKVKHKSINESFRKQNPNVKLPPDYLIYESYRLDYEKYYNGGRKAAQWLIDHFTKHTLLNNKTILDWGCGPGRTIRHFPQLLDKSNIFLATDYNIESVKWCEENIPDVSFNLNNLEAVLPYKSDSIDIIYGISIFTHLSEKAHFDWMQELTRVLKPEGIMLLSLQGDNFKIKLTAEELIDYNKGNLVVRGKVKEGHRTYSAFHPTPFVLKLFKELQILEHIVESPNDKAAIPQDLWIIRK